MSARKKMEDGYIYEPLPGLKVPSSPDGSGGSIRLLSFTGTTTASAGSEALEVTLRAHKLSEDLKFDALSYEWGQKAETEAVLLDGKNLSVPRSLYLFLKALRTSPDADSTLYFADAICIDQQNLRERASQVQLMGQVYTSARRVHIWLGPERAGIGLLFKFCNVLKGSETDAKVRDRFEQIFGEHNEAAFQEAVQAFTTCGYWKRLWVIQEILLAKELLVHCGKYLVNWNALYEGCQRVLLGEVWKSQSDPSFSFGGAESIAHAQPDDFDQSRYVSLYLQTTTESPVRSGQLSLRATRSKRLYTLRDAVTLHGLAECTDRHDRIFGLLGLVLRGNDKGYFQADYAESLATLFQRVMYQCHPDLRTDAIAFCRHLRHVLNLPFESYSESLKTAGASSGYSTFAFPSSLQYNIVVRYDGRLGAQVERLSDKAPADQTVPENKLAPVSTWEAGGGEICWSTVANAQQGDLVYSIDDSCCGAIFRKRSSQSKTHAKRKRTIALPPVFVGRAVAHMVCREGHSVNSAIESFLHIDHQFASKLAEERPLLERPGAPWESRVTLAELWALSCDIAGTRISSQGGILSRDKSVRSDSPARAQKWTGIRGKKPRFGFEWTSEAANSQ